MRLIRGIVFFMFSCIPGCGQMHQGYMKRGISQTVLCCGVLAVAVFLEIGALAILLVPLWLYSFFDSYNLRRQRMDGTEDEDAYLFGMSDLDTRRLSELFAKRHSLIGWALVLLGLYALYQTVVGQLMRWLRDLFPWTDWLYDLLVWDAPRILGTLLIIALGLWFIRGPKKRTPEEIPAFTPGPQAEGPGCKSEFFQEPPHAPDVPGGEPVTDAPAPEAEEEGPHGDN
nr:hypothetical protein [uncultured Oscillibacter sp.]